VKTHDIALACPFCGYTNDKLTGVGTDELPKNDSLILCMRCGNVGLFDSGAGVNRQPNFIESFFLNRRPEVRKVREAWIQTNLTRAGL
jgi:hypothetical protein